VLQCVVKRHEQHEMYLDIKPADCSWHCITVPLESEQWLWWT